MALNDISLTAGMRSNLISLQGTTKLLDRTQERLSSGKKVNSALDNPTNFFAAQAHTQRAADLSVRKDGMTEAVQGVQAANKGITGITALIEAAKGLTQAARSADTTNRNSLAGQFNTVLTQISQLASDSGYKGKNFLTGDSLNVLFNESGGSALTISGFSATSTGLGITAVTIASSATVSGSTTISATAAVAIHTGTLNTTSFTGVATGTNFLGVPLAAGNTTIASANTVSGGGGTGTGVATGTAFVFSLTGISGANSGNPLYSGAITVNKIYANGVDVSTLFTGGTFSGTSEAVAGQYTMTLNTGITGLAALAGFNTTGLVISLDVTINQRTSSGAAVTNPVNNVFDLKTGDIGSGLSVLSGQSWTGPSGSAVSGNSVNGLAVYIDGNYMSQASGWSVSGDSIVFGAGIVPPSATVTYAYNTGFTAGGALVFGGATSVTINNWNASTMSVSGVSLGGAALTSGQYSVSTGGVLTVAAGVMNSGSAALSYNVTTTVAGGWDSETGIDTAVNQLDSALSTLRTQSANLASNLSVVTIRQDFTDGMVNTLLKGADNLTLADMNEEGANMLMLQTRQQLGTTSLSMASQAAQSVLRLF
ncbi:flagellin B [Geobacter sp. OR-1]|uniref:flagellin N-terminal helical domain-containing protein n=1 Tax=Geobacter sp. OR-1 TaxID=1266765 RepID=UPI00054399E5|nr:flagellin B [Geobacter sp. OR-1]